MTTPGPDAPTPRINAWKVLIPVVVVIGGTVAVLNMIRSQHSSGRSQSTSDGTGGIFEARVGATVPDVDLPKLGGGVVKLSGLGSKVTLINFWATWCEACMVEMPTLVKLHEAYKSKGFEIAAINADENPDAVVPKTIADLRIPFPVFVDPEGRLADVFDVHAIPLTVILDSQRKVLLIETGERDWFGSEIRQLMDKWLG